MTSSDSTPCAVVTGAGSGIGRSIAVKLALSNWQVALIGRRPKALAESIALALAPAETPEAFACDVRDATAVESMASSVLKRFGRVHALINAAGINTPQRSLANLSVSDFRQVVETNLYGAYFCTQAFLPSMRQSGEGMIVNISSEAGRQASAKSGTAYVMSKFGLAGLTQSINAEERAHGIRASCIFPGDVATPLLDYRPIPPSTETRAQMLQPEDVATCVLFALTLPHRAIVEEIVISPTMK